MNEVLRVRGALAPDHISAVLAFRGACGHHDPGDGGHDSDGIFLPWVAAALFRQLPLLQVDALCAARVHETVKLYRLPEGAEVPLHTDQDFEATDGARALYSILVRLNDSYVGGEMLFRGVPVHANIGDALVFPHSVPHQGRTVAAGEKYVLKADLLFA